MSGDTEWRWADPSGQQRLVRTDELRAALASGVLAPNTPVWRQGWAEWLPATDVPELITSALSAANGVVPNIPPPPMNVVAAQHAFEGEPVATEDKSQAEPPPPPRYTPAATRPKPVLLHTPSQPMRVPSTLAGAVNPAPHYAVNANTAVNIRALNEGDADALVSKPARPMTDLESPPKRSEAADAQERKTVPNPVPPVPPASATLRPARPDAIKSVPPAPPSRPPVPTTTASGIGGPGPKNGSMGLASLVRTSPPPPAVRGAISRPPPPPRASTPGRPASKTTPPRVEDAGKEVIEELSGSVLLTDQSGGQNAIEELSGSILLPDQSGSVQTTGVYREQSGALLLPDLSGPSPVIAPRPSPNEELSGNFLLDAGSTGALPSVESTGKILAAKAASRAPFAPAYEPPATRLTPAPIIPLSIPLGSTPPPPQGFAPSGFAAPGTTPATGNAPTSASSPVASPAAGVPNHHPTLLGFKPAGALPDEPAPAATPANANVAEERARGTLMGVSPPPEDALARAAASEAHAPANVPSFAPPAPAEPSARTTDAPGHDIPPPERSSARLHDFRALGHDPRARYVLVAFGVGGLIVLTGVIGLIVGAVGKKPSDETATATVANASAAPSASASAKRASPVVPVATAAAPAAAGALGAACTLAGAAHVIAPRAVVQSGVEASVVGSRLAIGFASREREGFAVAIDPSSAVAELTVRAHAASAIRRLVPIPGTHAGNALGAAADVDSDVDLLGGRRTIPATHPFDLGLGAGGLAWAPYRSADVSPLWALDGDDPVEAIRATPLDPNREEAGWAIAFRRGTAIYAGAVNGGAALTPRGPLVKVAGLGPQVGSPTVAAQDGAVLVAWADRGQPSEPWSLRWMRFAPGDASADAKPFVPSEGGLGEHAMSPTIAAAGQGRFVLAWTEGPVSTHQVRAQTINGSGVPLGNAMAISDSGVNAGQAQLAILPDGHGVVAYLASSGGGPKGGYEVLATPIVCP